MSKSLYAIQSGELPPTSTNKKPVRLSVAELKAMGDYFVVPFDDADYVKTYQRAKNAAIAEGKRVSVRKLEAGTGIWYAGERK